jgi:hypothetical protein
MWRRFCSDHNQTCPPKRAGVYWASRFVLDVLSGSSVATRASCINALSEYHRVYLKVPDPFKVNPWPYPLLRRFLPQSFDQLLQAVRHSDFTNPERCAVALVLVCGASKREAETWSGMTGNLARFPGRVVPLTDEVAQWLQYTTTPADLKAGLHRLGVTVVEVAGALTAELVRRRVPEVTRAAVYGRWSAMQYAVPTGPIGLFRTPGWFQKRP